VPDDENRRLRKGALKANGGKQERERETLHRYAF
jgi:hypothetical protein